MANQSATNLLAATTLAATTLTTTKSVGQYLSFEVAGRPYCASLNAVREVRRIGVITEVPQSADHILGVANLRGDIIPVIDLQRLLTGSCAVNRSSQPTCLIAEVDDRLAAFCVDGVSDVIEISADEILPIPASVVTAKSSLFVGIVLVNGVHVTEINVDKLVRSIQQMEAVA